MNLCSLVDLKLTGKISRDDMVHIAKMMDCHLTAYDLEAMLELLPVHVVSKDGMIDYRQVQNLLQSYSAREPTRDIEPRLSASYGGLPRSSQALPAYATPHTLLHVPGGIEPVLNRSITTPLGYQLNTPYKHVSDQQLSLSTGVYDHILTNIIKRIYYAISEKTRLYGTPYSLRGHCENLDISNTGVISTHSLQRVLDEIGINLNPSELHTIYGLYGRPQEDAIYYDSLCRAIDVHASATIPSNGFGTTNGVAGAAAAAYLSDRTLQRVRELRTEGRYPRDMFEAYDLDHTGLITVSKFQEVVSRLSLLQTEHQLSKAIEDFSSIGNRYVASRHLTYLDNA
jgi:Ca2+-binding EF-hand superfamily protein